jgi:hypothetical protein
MTIRGVKFVTFLAERKVNKQCERGEVLSPVAWRSKVVQGRLRFELRKTEGKGKKQRKQSHELT